MKKNILMVAMVCLSFFLFCSAGPVMSQEDMPVEPPATESSDSQSGKTAEAPKANTFYLVAFKGVDVKMLEEVAPLMSKVLFDIPVKVLSITPDIPAEAYEKVRDKYYAGKIVEFLAAMNPKDSLGIVGVVKEPIFAGPSPYVNGLGLPGKAAVVSLAMITDADYYRTRRRVLSESLHEIGHVYGLEHEDKYYCLMQDTHDMKQLDAREIDFCSAHMKQLYDGIKKKMPGLKAVDFYKKKDDSSRTAIPADNTNKEKKADNQPPELGNVYPDRDAVVDPDLQYITAMLIDQPEDGVGIDPSGIMILLDGAQTMFNYNANTGELKARMMRLDPGPHTLEIHAMDRANNSMAPYFATFMVQE